MKFFNVLSIFFIFILGGSFIQLNLVQAEERTCEQIYADCKEKGDICQKRIKTCNDKKKIIGHLQKTTNHFDVDVLNVASESKLQLQGEHDDTNIISKIIKLFAQLLGMVAVGLYIAGAYFLITAQDEQGLQQGKDIFQYTTMGLVVAFLSYIIVQFIINIIFGA